MNKVMQYVVVIGLASMVPVLSAGAFGGFYIGKTQKMKIHASSSVPEYKLSNGRVYPMPVAVKLFLVQVRRDADAKCTETSKVVTKVVSIFKDKTFTKTVKNCSFDHGANIKSTLLSALVKSYVLNYNGYWLEDWFDVRKYVNVGGNKAYDENTRVFAIKLVDDTAHGPYGRSTVYTVYPSADINEHDVSLKRGIQETMTDKATVEKYWNDMPHPSELSVKVQRDGDNYLIAPELKKYFKYIYKKTRKGGKTVMETELGK